MPDETDPEALYLCAKKAALEKEFTLADTLLQELLDREPASLKGLDLLGFVRFFQKRYTEAEACCRKALELKPDHAYALKGLGLSLARQGRLEEGVAALQSAIGCRPQWFDPYWDLAVVLLEHNQDDKALEVLYRGQAHVPAKHHRFAALINRIKTQGET